MLAGEVERSIWRLVYACLLLPSPRARRDVLQVERHLRAPQQRLVRNAAASSEEHGRQGQAEEVPRRVHGRDLRAERTEARTLLCFDALTAFW